MAVHFMNSVWICLPFWFSAMAKQAYSITLKHTDKTTFSCQQLIDYAKWKENWGRCLNLAPEL